MLPEAAQQVDLLLECRWLLPMTDDQPSLEWQGVAIDKGLIVGYWPLEEARQRVMPDRVHALHQHAVIPGLVNAHNHAGMSLLRGYADDLPLMSWLNDHIWPAEARFMRGDFVADGTRLAMAEMIRSGTTTFSDMYLAPEDVVDSIAEFGMRAQLCTPLIDFDIPWSRNFTHGLEKTRALTDQIRPFPALSLAFGPHAPYTVSDESLTLLARAQQALGLPIQMHVHETADEVNQGVTAAGIRPIERLHRAGLLGPGFQAVHMTQLTESDMALVKSTGTSVIHCPQSNLKLASGMCPVKVLLDQGIPVALGTDGACSNNDLDMFDEMKTAALLAKGHSGNAQALPAMDALAMATREGARALGLGDITGQIRTGYAADITAVDLQALNTVPVHHPESALVYAVNSCQVSHVMVAGKLLLEHGQLTGIDEKALLDTVAQRLSEMTTEYTQ
ncbi:TRZ/ATZ family hydrolase [Larsenimonas rhizosphaerae]|uniref:TRZ/ATZ family hydrolase n=1 Tax=Larsenimonas rhizosphaerae TaxID=2944682 RepID=UPI0020341150|nr:TRZ/ATZ family hydrolase [Larsenimonas rhizosphaerae]MCM2130680.1 TRZ/ATZ family hydrolase [Larsenimonas rhizosphaerae]